MPDFTQTRMGQMFLDHTMPRIAAALERIANALEAQAKASKGPPVEVDKELRDDPTGPL